MKPAPLSASLTRTRWRTLSIVLVTIVSLFAATIGTAEAQRDAPQRDAPQRDAPQRDVRPDRERPAPVVETLRLRCAPDFINGQRGVLCEWSEATNPTTRAYQLYRITNGSARELLVTRSADGRRAYFDTDVNAPSSLVYGVISVNRNGRLLGQSAPQSVQFGSDIEDLRLACAPDSLNGSRGVLCRWSKASHPDVRGYVLYRSVAGGDRQAIARVGLDGRTAFFDTRVRPGAVYVYGVTAVNGNGSVIGTGGPVRVLWPAAD